MKVYRQALYTLFILTAVLLSSCGPKKTALRLNFEKGKTYYYDVTSDQDISQTIMGQQVAIRQQMIFGIAMEVVDKDKDSNLVISTMYNKIKFRQESATGVIEYDSDKPASDSSDNPLARVFSSMKGGSFTVVMTPMGKVKEVRGYEDLVNRVVDNVSNGSDSLKAVMKNTVGSQFSDKSVIESLESSWNIYPEETISEGDHWTKTIKTSSGFPIISENTYTVKKISSDKVTLDVSSKIHTDENTKPNSMGMLYDISGTQTGKLVLDKQSGMIEKGDLKQEMQGSLTLRGEGPGEKLQWPMSIKSSTKIESRTK